MDGEGGADEPGDGEKGGLAAGEEVAGVEEDLGELDEEEGDIGRAGELGCHRVPLLESGGLRKRGEKKESETTFEADQNWMEEERRREDEWRYLVGREGRGRVDGGSGGGKAAGGSGGEEGVWSSIRMGSGW